LEGDLLIPAEEVNQNHLKYLCKQSGIPEHFLTISQEKPQSAVYFEIVKKFQTKESDIKNDLNVLLGELLHKDNPFDFPAISGVDLLLDPKFNQENEDTKKTIESYEKEPYLKPDNFLNNEEFNKKLTILVRNKEIADRFFATTKDWILPQNQHLVLRQLEEYLKIPSHTKAVFIQQHQDFLGLKKELLTTEKKLSVLSTESTEAREVRIIQEALKNAAEIGNQPKITTFFKKVTREERQAMKTEEAQATSVRKRTREGDNEKQVPEKSIRICAEQVSAKSSAKEQNGGRV